MRVCIIGSTGMLGSALSKEATARDVDFVGVARSQAHVSVDIINERSLTDFLLSENFDVIINTVAIVNHDLCEKNPELAYMVNARPASIIEGCIRNSGVYFIQISTDGFFSGDTDQKHGESSHVCILNEYARTKFIAESFALINPDALVVRTNIVGFGNEKKPTFVDWIIDSFKKKSKITLFNDYFVSSISVAQFAKSLFDLIDKRPCGIINLAAREVFSKAQFITVMASFFGFDLSNTSVGSVKRLSSKRAESLGLDVAKAEKILNYSLPSLEEVVSCLREEYFAKF